MKNGNEVDGLTSVSTLIALYDLHTKLFLNVINGVSDEEAHKRLNTEANHVAWIAGSLVHERYELANATGIELKQTSHELFRNHKGIQTNITYPSLTEFELDWKRITPMLRNALLHLSDRQLKSTEPYGVPGDELSFIDAITFILDRESYCIGQIGLYRRLLGHSPMKYL